MSNLDSKSECIVDTERAKGLAEPFGRFDKDGKLDLTKKIEKDPLEEIPASLLSAEQIIEYVTATGLIAPFFIGGGLSSLLKDASYEGRIGTVAYIFKENASTPTRIFSSDDKILVVPANSIVFVECDLDFRLPAFIALRFNLQIKHVHRGLLLGTGPLIDPGYWGKLCIPLHNLTDEPYEIPKEEGLIWIEFTKTSGETNKHGRPPLGKTFWNIKEFLTKASASLIYGSERSVGIRSSIPSISAAASQNSKEALDVAKTARRYNFWGLIAGGVTGLGVFVSVLALTYGYYSSMNTQFKELTKLQWIIANHLNLIDTGASSSLESKRIISELAKSTKHNSRSAKKMATTFKAERKIMQKYIEGLTKQNIRLEKRILQLEKTSAHRKKKTN